MASGVKVREDVVNLFNGVKMGKVRQNLVVMKIEKMDDSEKIIVDEDYSATVDWKSFVESLPDTDARYVIFDYPYTPANRNVATKQLIFLTWCPDTVPVKTKMLYASSKDAVKRAIGYECPTYQADCREECMESVILEKLK